MKTKLSNEISTKSVSRAEKEIRRAQAVFNDEIQGLRERYSSLLGLRTFHDVLLGGGELPFHLVEKRVARIIHERFHQKKKKHS